MAVRDDNKQKIQRRSANWPANFWDYKFVGSLGTEYTGERFVQEINTLKEKVKGMINAGNTRPLDKLELIDAVQRLGLGYHFEVEIRDALDLVRETYLNGGGSDMNNLYSTALLFRLLRQHGFHIQQEAFEIFLKKDTFGSLHQEDVIKGVLALYEASFHSVKGESIMEQAKVGALNHLKSLDMGKLKTFPNNLARKVERALYMPLRWTSNRSEARWFIDIYEQDLAMKPNLLRLAKLDFNLVQSQYRTEVAQLSSWWTELGVERFDVLRDRLMENYLWGTIIAFEPRWSDYRVMLIKIGNLITIIDDVYDIFGTMEELEILTDFIDRWDISGIDKLPPVIRSTYMALYNSTNEIAHRIMRDRGINVLPCLQMMWARHCKGYLREAKWYNSGCKPTFEECIVNGTNTIGCFIMLLIYFIGMARSLDKEAIDFACNIPPILYNAAFIVRLLNDLGTSQYEMARGDNFKAVQCYQNPHRISVEEAREAIWSMVEEAWKNMNQLEFEEYPSFASKDYLNACLGFARGSHFFHQYGDGQGFSDKETKEYLMSLVVEPVSI
ncbi:hypothetical protein MLD38_029288 [Melastoma candidum]|uniref:Uncharacterized protein n=1 Tax=Melastoma candidum TaxID=119954 RepID=A0ACB9N386_9MYRT|nr:hypothetical protein MLD38_029288 [Melastoma candidum]